MAHPRRIVALALVLCALAPLLGEAPAGSQPISTGPVEFGAYPKPHATEGRKQATLNLETAIGRPLAVVRVYDYWNSPFPDSYTSWLQSTGHVIALSVKAKTSSGTVIPWASIATAQPGDAVYQQELNWANQVKAFGSHMYFIFNHEPETKVSAKNGTAADFIAAWQQMHNIFQQVGATNAEWVWTMTGFSFMVASTDPRYAANWYPGDGYVDDVAADVYNWYTCRAPAIKNPWTALEQLAYSPATNLGGVVNFVDTYHPTEGIILMEWASVEDSADPTRRASWIAQAESNLQGPEWTNLKAVLYFNTQDSTYTNCKWWVDSQTTQSLQAFATMANDPYYGRYE